MSSSLRMGSDAGVPKRLANAVLKRMLNTVHSPASTNTSHHTPSFVVTA